MHSAMRKSNILKPSTHARFFVVGEKSFQFWNEDCRMGREKKKKKQEREQIKELGGRGAWPKEKKKNNTKVAMKVMAPCRSS